ASLDYLILPARPPSGSPPEGVSTGTDIPVRIFSYSLFSSRELCDSLIDAPPLFSISRGRIPKSAPVTHQVQGRGRFLQENSSRAWQVLLPKKTVGTTPPARVNMNKF